MMFVHMLIRSHICVFSVECKALDRSSHLHCGSFMVIFLSQCFVASLINVLPAQSSYVPFVVMPRSFHFVRMDLMLLSGVFKVFLLPTQPSPILHHNMLIEIPNFYIACI